MEIKEAEEQEKAAAANGDAENNGEGIETEVKEEEDETLNSGKDNDDTPSASNKNPNRNPKISIDSEVNNNISEVEMEIKEAEEQEKAAAANGDVENNGEGIETEVKEEEDETLNSGKDNDDTPSASKPSIEGASPGKIFVGGLPKDTTDEAFTKHFDKYGKIVDSVIMKHRGTGHPRGFGFITYEDPAVVDAVILDTHVFEGKQVEIKRTIPKGAISGKDFKTKKIFVGGIPTSVNEDELKNFFSKFGEIEEHLVMRDHTSGRSRGFGFVSFSTEKAVDDLLTKGNKIEFAGVQVEIKKAEPKKSGDARAPPLPAKYNNPKHSFGRGRGFKDHYSGGIESGPYRYSGGFGSRSRGHGGYGEDVYAGYGGTGLGSYRGESSIGYPNRYGGGLGRGYGLGAYDGPSDSYGRYYYSNPKVDGYGYGGSFPGLYDLRRGYGGGPGGRYHPYGR